MTVLLNDHDNRLLAKGNDSFTSIYKDQLNYLDPYDFNDEDLISAGINKVFHRKRLLTRFTF